jgi:hypothetical protein
MLETIITLLLSLTMPEGKPDKVKVGKGTTFYPVEKGLNNGKFACGGQEWKDPDLPVCATRGPAKRSWSIPCGTWVHIENVRTGDTAWCKVMDRGPYGKIDTEGHDKGEWFNASVDRKLAEEEGREPRKGKYRAVIDMSRSVSKKLRSKGILKVRIRWWRNNPLRQSLDNILIGRDIFPGRRMGPKKNKRFL